MPKHAFRFPPSVIQAVRRHVHLAVGRVHPGRFRQEANYTAALALSLEGPAYDGEHGIVIFQSTVFDDRGPNSAESRFGADFAVTAHISDGRVTVEKAIVVQTKLGSIEQLNSPDRKFLHEQIKKMRRLVPAPKVMQVLEENGRRVPQMISGNKILAGAAFSRISLPEYFVARVTTTFDGCTRPEVVEAVKNSSLSRVHVSARLGDPDDNKITPPARRVYEYA